MPRISPEKYFQAVSAALIFTLLFASIGFAFVNIFSDRAAFAQGAPSNAVQNRSIQVSLEYAMHKEGLGGYSEKYFAGSAIMTPVTGGYDYAGKGTGTLSGVDVAEPFNPCNEPQRTDYAGSADLIVNARYAPGKFVPGPVTWQYYDNTTEISLEVESDNLSYHSTGVVTETGCTTASGTYGNGFFCYFYGVDFTVGGTYKVNQEGDPDATCKLQIGPAVSTLKISGKVTGNFGNKGTLGISNSRVVMAKLDDPPKNKLSISKPDFMQETATSDDSNAKYEFMFGRGSGELPTMLVVSLLWYEGNPEFAITSGKETDGRFIPVYQALCVDDDPGTKCEKWQETASGYEAEVDFEYGNVEKLAEGWSVVEPEDWVTGAGNANSSLIGSTVMMVDSAYMYYNSYRAMKYFETLGLPALQPVLIEVHPMDAKCSGAYYDAPAKLNSKFPNFGDLGTFLGKVEATGSGVYICDNESALESPDAPVNREWHELGHYLMFQLYSNPYVTPYGTPHNGYLNDGTNDSMIEGFAEFVAMLINEHYGEPRPYIYPVATGRYNLEQDYKVWGPWIHEEFAVAGILWDLHDAGIESNSGSVLNGTLIPVTVWSYPVKDEISLDGRSILAMLDKSEPKTLVELRKILYPNYDSKAVAILINHGDFADTVKRDWRYDVNKELSGETGTLVNPARLVRYSPAPELLGSNLVSDRDATFNVTINHLQSFRDYDYSYLFEMRSGQPTYFSVPPEYYPSKVTVTPLSVDGRALTGALEFDSDDYWQYINSNPPADGVFRQISVMTPADNGNATSLQYIQNVRDLLKRASEEYGAGNATGAEALATTAYLDNFEYVESDLEQRNATELKEQTEQLMRVELIALINDGADPQVVDDKIAEINAKLDEAIVVVPEFLPFMISLILMTFMSGIIYLRRKW